MDEADIDNTRVPMDLRLLSADQIALLPSQDESPHEHFVEIYEDDASLAASVATFIALGIERGEPGIVIGTEAHRRAFKTELAKRVDLDSALEEGLYQEFDAAETLAKFMDGGMPDWPKFRATIGPKVAEASKGGVRPRLFGEMVALLWDEGNLAGALRLEEHWNKLADDYRFNLFCAYPTRAFATRNLAPLKAVCGRHSHVLVR